MKETIRNGRLLTAVLGLVHDDVRAGVPARHKTNTARALRARLVEWWPAIPRNGSPGAVRQMYSGAHWLTTMAHRDEKGEGS